MIEPLQLASGSVQLGRAWFILEDLDVIPVFVPPQCRQLFYKRSEAERALSAYLLPRAQYPAACIPLLH